MRQIFVIVGSLKLLQKLGDKYEVIKQELEEVVTESGKELKLQGYVLNLNDKSQFAVT